MTPVLKDKMTSMPPNYSQNSPYQAHPFNISHLKQGDNSPERSQVSINLNSGLFKLQRVEMSNQGNQGIVPMIDVRKAGVEG